MSSNNPLTSCLPCRLFSCKTEGEDYAEKPKGTFTNKGRIGMSGVRKCTSSIVMGAWVSRTPWHLSKSMDTAKATRVSRSDLHGVGKSSNGTEHSSRNGFISESQFPFVGSPIGASSIFRSLSDSSCEVSSIILFFIKIFLKFRVDLQ